MNLEKNLIVKNRLETIKIKLNKILESHYELKHILKESIILDDKILEEDLFLNIENDIIEIQLDVDLFIKNIMSSF